MVWRRSIVSSRSSASWPAAPASVSVTLRPPPTATKSAASELGGSRLGFLLVDAEPAATLAIDVAPPSGQTAKARRRGNACLSHLLMRRRHTSIAFLRRGTLADRVSLSLQVVKCSLCREAWFVENDQSKA